MALAHEDDIVFGFRQTLEEELRRVQDGGDAEPLHIEGAPVEENLRRLVTSSCNPKPRCFAPSF